MIYVMVISCFTSFVLGVGFGCVFLFERSFKRAFEDSVS